MEWQPLLLEQTMTEKKIVNTNLSFQRKTLTAWLTCVSFFNMFFSYSDVTNERFFIIGFMSLCDMPDDKFMPCEMGIAEYSLRDGIVRCLHKYIDPGKFFFLFLNA